MILLEKDTLNYLTILQMQKMKNMKTISNSKLGLPKNPEWHPNRSHALAFEWNFYNIVKI